MRKYLIFIDIYVYINIETIYCIFTKLIHLVFYLYFKDNNKQNKISKHISKIIKYSLSLFPYKYYITFIYIFKHIKLKQQN